MVNHFRLCKDKLGNATSVIALSTTTKRYEAISADAAWRSNMGATNVRKGFFLRGR